MTQTCSQSWVSSAPATAEQTAPQGSCIQMAAPLLTLKVCCFSWQTFSQHRCSSAHRGPVAWILQACRLGYFQLTFRITGLIPVTRSAVWSFPLFSCDRKSQYPKAKAGESRAGILLGSGLSSWLSRDGSTDCWHHLQRRVKYIFSSISCACCYASAEHHNRRRHSDNVTMTHSCFFHWHQSDAEEFSQI